MYALYNLISTVITLYIWVLIVAVVLDWLVVFNVLNPRNQAVYLVRDLTGRLTEPLLRPIRSLLPSMGGLDISPVLLILALYFVRDLAFQYLRP
jgi:YggT family protein